jgi:hypothetical protein
MTRFLWTGESEFCICGHHITEHTTTTTTPTTTSWLCGLEPSLITCNGKDHKTGSSSNWRSCKCDGFKPYRINQDPEEKEKEEYSCYYCDELKPTYEKRDYEYHIVTRHAGGAAYPNKSEIEKRRLNQGKNWEI